MAFLLALASAALYGAADFIGGIASRRAATVAVVLCSQATGLVVLAAVLPFAAPMSASTRDFVWGGVAGLAGGVGVALLYRALAIGVMALVAPVTAVCAVTIPVGFGLLSGDRPAPVTLYGIALALVAIVLVSQTQSETLDPVPAARSAPHGHGSHRTAFALALLSGVAIGVFFLALARTGLSAGLWPLVSARGTSVVLFGLLAGGGGVSLRLPAGVWRLMLGCGVLDMAANALYLLATREGSLSVVVTLASLYPAATVLLARVMLHERLSRAQAAGVGCALAAVLMIVGGER